MLCLNINKSKFIAFLVSSFNMDDTDGIKGVITLYNYTTHKIIANQA